MKTSDFSFELPERQIAKYPLKKRSQSKLLCLNGQTGQMRDQKFSDVLDFLEPGDLLVFNNTKVMAARLYGQKASGGKLEILIERVLSDAEVLAHIKCSRSPKAGQEILIANQRCLVLERVDNLFHLKFQSADVFELMSQAGHMPLPPYMQRDDEREDQERYQTRYAKVLGAVAAPTAGLHFDDELLESIKNKGINTAELTLHVGAGTFQPVKVEDVSAHKMHREWVSLSSEVVDKIKQTKALGKRVVAVGTTSVRSLESAALSGEIKEFEGDTDIFIYPGFKFKVVDAILTNFHLPESTLLMLVSAFAGKENILNAYNHAIESGYRFYSYGDAMLLTPQTLNK